MELFQTILLSVCLTALAHVQSSNSLSIADFFTNQWKEYIGRLETWIDATEDLLPFLFRENVIRDLDHNSHEFTNLLMKIDSELSEKQGAISPVNALDKTIDVIYNNLNKRTKNNGDKLMKIRKVDPLGFEAYLRIKNDRDTKTLDIDECVDEYMETMYNRIILHGCLHNVSSIKDPELNANGKLKNIPEAIRKEIATEYAPVSEATINYFLDIAAAQYPKTKIYHVRGNKLHDSKGSDGLRIFSAGRVGPQKEHNWLCVKYNSYTKKLHVYNNIYTTSTVDNNIKPIQENIINSVFPDKIQPIVYDKSKTPTTNPASSGLYAIIYAATSLNGEDPAKITFRMNNMYGDQALYMRLHILKMFANKRLSAMH